MGLRMDELRDSDIMASLLFQYAAVIALMEKNTLKGVVDRGAGERCNHSRV